METLIAKLTSRLSNYVNQEFALVVNNKLMMADKYVGRIRLARIAKTTTLQIGHRKNVNDTPKFVESATLKNNIMSEIHNYNVAGIDFKNIATDNYLIDYDLNLKVIYITTSLHRKYLEILKRESNAPLQLSTTVGTTLNLSTLEIRRFKEEYLIEMYFRYRDICQILKRESNAPLQLSTTVGTTLNLSTLEIRRFKEEYLIEMYFRYRDICQELLLRKLTNTRSANFRELQFFKTAKAFVPVLLEGTFLFNPLTEVPMISKLFKETDFYKKCQEVGYVKCGDVSVYYLTHLEISQAFHLTKFGKYTAPLIMAMLFSQYIPGIADDDTVIYMVRRENRLDVTHEVIPAELIDNFPDIKYMYEPISALYYACLVRTNNEAIAKRLYNVVKDYSL